MKELLPCYPTQSQNTKRCSDPYISSEYALHQSLDWIEVGNHFGWTGQQLELLKYGAKLDLVYGVGLLERVYVESFGATRWASPDVLP